MFRPELYSRLSGLPLGRRITAQSIARALLHPEGILRGCPPGARRLVLLNKADSAARRNFARAIADSICEQGCGRLDRVLVGSLHDPALIHDWVDVPRSCAA